MSVALAASATAIGFELAAAAILRSEHRKADRRREKFIRTRIPVTTGMEAADAARVVAEANEETRRLADSMHGARLRGAEGQAAWLSIGGVALGLVGAFAQHASGG